MKRVPVVMGFIVGWLNPVLSAWSVPLTYPRKAGGAG